MDIVNAELVLQNEVSVKFILNESAVIFFSASQQHRDNEPDHSHR
ncbi:MAG: hypothetical protein JWL90_1609 [Chthoniobacteraceae bacterium]|nr:hypothetical protein [Chthoniobacteraceae bacterium]